MRELQVFGTNEFVLARDGRRRQVRVLVAASSLPAAQHAATPPACTAPFAACTPP